MYLIAGGSITRDGKLTKILKGGFEKCPKKCQKYSKIA